MGLNVRAITDVEVSGCHNVFSKNFCYFLCGLDAHINPELEQLEKVLNCELSALKSMDLYHYSEDQAEALRQAEVELPAGEERIKQRFREGRSKAYQQISQVKSTLQKLLLLLETSEGYYEQVVYNEHWIYDYFKGGDFRKDVKQLLEFAICAEGKGAGRITFLME